MCGIIGISKALSAKSLNTGTAPETTTAPQTCPDLVQMLLDGLMRLEYRGYDSAGLGLWGKTGLKRLRAVGPVKTLVQKVSEEGFGQDCLGTGIAHTRWATHGRVTETNAHPQGTGRVLVVHNGVIENAAELKTSLMQNGVTFESDTDTEILAHLVEKDLPKDLSPEHLLDHIRRILAPLKGSFAALFLLADYPGALVACRQGFSPLTVGRNADYATAGSDAVALAGLAPEIAYLDDGDMAFLSPTHILCTGAQGIKQLSFVPNPVSADNLGKGGHTHFMHKEMHEQPDILKRLVQGFQKNSEDATSPFTQAIKAFPKDMPFLRLVGCGTALYAAEISAYAFGHLAGLPIITDFASEFRHKQAALTKNTWVGFISQSGETADTLSAMNTALDAKAKTFVLTNTQGSSMDRLAGLAFSVQAGPEIGVASTKAFTAQLMTLYLLAIRFGHARGTLHNAQTQKHLQDLEDAANRVQKTLDLENAIHKAALNIVPAPSCLFLGRAALAPLALEGALKMKELSYIHAEGYPAGEMKHGPIALLQEDRPCIVLAPSDHMFEKNLVTVQEIIARGSRVLMLTDAAGQQKVPASPDIACLVLPDTSPLTAPFVYAAALQMLAYHTAVLKGVDVDRPRNLAKSVTVE